MNSTARARPVRSGGSSSTIAVTRSRVTPGVGSTIDTFDPAIRFNNELLPTFGRPTMAILGSGMMKQ